MKRNATAVWLGTGKEGKGTLTVQSKLFTNAAYSSASRFEQAKGTNPEELVAAAHAGCFSMKLAYLLDAAGFVAGRIETGCTVTLEEGWITKSHLTLKAQIKGITREKFDELVKDAEMNCPVSRSIKAEISVEATLNE
jgi:lipoyl-dependent peroxiredoxin